MTRKLDNYLKMHRKQAGLTQDRMAFIVGHPPVPKTGRAVSRYELGERLPSLRTALAYQAVFEVPVHELFAGIYETVTDEVEERARVVAEDLACGGKKPKTAKKHKGA